MESSSPLKMAPQSSLFQVYLRLRPPIQQVQLSKQQQQQQVASESWLIVEPPLSPVSQDDCEDGDSYILPSHSTHITLQPPNDSRKRAIERFGFTKIFREDANQLDVLQETGTVETVRSVLQNGRDGLVATLGVTGSGKSHTILGSKSQRGLTQMTLDILFQSIGENIRQPRQPDLSTNTNLLGSLQASDPSEAQIMPAAAFLDSVYGSSDGERARLSRAQTPMSRAQTPMMDAVSHHSRRPPPPQPSTLAQGPDVSSYSIEIGQDYEYAILISMYEVYNDRIFDLLSNTNSPNAAPMTTRQGVALQKGLLRRPLLFKNTEMSPDRKVVAGLRKIVCGSYDEAMMVLETGLLERRVAGTGSNSVSSRSHGFFCIEVKKNLAKHRYGRYDGDNWTGGTLSIVDLAGSERARNAKTTGSTLAEAGKINESLMYLGQCLQVQSDCQHDGSKPIVPFRQCKLTELLFSNSFPTSNNPSVTYMAPQKAVMIVTADPQGDFNATSQILRYSALAREVTIPRIPSVASAILSGGLKSHQQMLSGRSTPHDMSQELEQATNEVAKLVEECDALAVRVAEEEIKRTEAELKLQAAEERAIETEQETREECWAEMEERIEAEKERWRAAWEHEKLRGEEYMDGKLDILGKASTFHIHEDFSSRDYQVEELERENEQLRAKLRALEQEMQTRSPTKRRSAPKTPAKGLVLQETSNSNIATNPFLTSLRARESDITSQDSDAMITKHSEASPRKQSLRSSSATQSTQGDSEDFGQTPGTMKKKQQRKLTTRKWDLGDPNELG